QSVIACGGSGVSRVVENLKKIACSGFARSLVVPSNWAHNPKVAGSTTTVGRANCASHKLTPARIRRNRGELRRVGWIHPPDRHSQDQPADRLRSAPSKKPLDSPVQLCRRHVLVP